MQISFHPQSFINLSFQSSLVPRSCISIHLSYIIFFLSFLSFCSPIFPFFCTPCVSIHVFTSKHFLLLLYFYLFDSVPAHLFFICSFIYTPIHVFQPVPLRLPVFLSAGFCVYPSFHLSAFPSDSFFYMSVFPFVRFSICPSFHLYVFLSLRLSIISLNIYQFFYLCPAF